MWDVIGNESRVVLDNCTLWLNGEGRGGGQEQVAAREDEAHKYNTLTYADVC
jgi:hypothetical protein